MWIMQYFEEFQAGLQRHGGVVMAVVVRTTGSAPRKAGARMLVFPDGSSHGTVGGGILETKVMEDATRFFAASGPDRPADTLFKNYILQTEGEAAIGSFCGGSADVFFEYFETAPPLVIFGAGHCGRALAQAAAWLDFRILLVDQRTELLDEVPRWGLARAAGTFHLSIPEGDLPVIDHRSFVVIMTSSHDVDEQILRRVIRSGAAYIGMIASRNKARLIRERLQQDGYTEAELSRVHMPIGLPIGSETPAEIAVSILGEMVAVRRKGGNKVK
jgi:xanthine dehydrogenase accessory factor